MKMSRRAQRMERRHKRARSGIGLNLVSLMDIFTILVFFLLVHSSDGEVLPSTKAVRLPESLAEKAPKQTLVVTVGDHDILVQGRRVAAVSEVMDAGSDIIEPLKAELDYQASRTSVAGGQGSATREVTIMGDKEIPYRLLKKIMLTCVRASYENISLAVLQKQQPSG
jgi:biopolymer transport protein ExbD